MEFAGIITEYDPFHNGHAAQLRVLRQSGARSIAVCMSCGAVQRGGMALLPWWVRCKAALQSGADLVVALPAPYACASAEAFAGAGVRLLTALGCDTLAFGAETVDTAALQSVAQTLHTPAWQQALRAQLQAGQPFAAARAAAAESLNPGSGALLRTANNILGVEYCKAIMAQNSPLRPLALPRLGAAHGSSGVGEYEGVKIASASHLRVLVAAQGITALRDFVPPNAYELYRQAEARGEGFSPERYSLALLTRLRAGVPAGFAGVRGSGEGLDNRLRTALRTATDADALLQAMKTKRYPDARLRRLLLDAALGHSAKIPPPGYLHLLGAQKAALPLLKSATLPAGTSLAKLTAAGAQAQILGDMHSNAVDFSALCRDKILPMGLVYTVKAVVL